MYVPFAAKPGYRRSLWIPPCRYLGSMRIPVGMPIQGNLDPVYLLTGGDAMDAAVDQIKGACVNRPHIFNLGHGVDKHTSPDTVLRLVDCIRNKAAKIR